MLRIQIKVLSLAIALSLIASPAFAGWTADTDTQIYVLTC